MILLDDATAGSPGYSVGMTNFELAQTLVRLGAVRGMELDGGGSSTLAFEGTVLNSPSDGRERAVSTALMLQYYGVYAPPPLEAVVSPNGDGVAEEQALSFKVVRPSTTTVTLTAPGRDGRVAGSPSRASRDVRGRVPARPAPPPPPEGTPPAAADHPAPACRGPLDADGSGARRPGADLDGDAPLRRQLDAGVLRVAPARVVVPPTGGRADIRWTQARAARVKVTVETAEGVVVRTVVERTASRRASRRSPGTARRQRQARRAVATSSASTATNELGVVSLTQLVTVRRVTRVARPTT